MLAVSARVADEGHAARRCILHHGVNVLVVVLQLVLLDDHLLVLVEVPVHFYVQLETINALLVVADRDRLWHGKLFLNVAHE